MVPDYSEYFAYLDALRESGITNMFGAGPFLMEEYGLSRTEARTVLISWMENFQKTT